MSVYLDATTYLKNTTDSAWGSAGTLFYILLPAWAQADSASHVLIFKANTAFDLTSGGWFAQKLASNNFETGFYHNNTDYRFLVTSTVFVNTVWGRHLFDWDTGAASQRYYYNGNMEGSRDGAFTVPTSANQITFGCFSTSGAQTEPASSYFACFARWNRRLTDEEKITLYTTNCPLFIPGGLQEYHNFLNPERAHLDVMGRVPLTVVGTLVRSEPEPTPRAILGAAQPPMHYIAAVRTSTLAPAAVSFQTIEPPLVSNAFQVFAPSVTIQTGAAQSLTPPLVSTPFQVFAPSITIGIPPPPPIAITTYPPTIDSLSNLLIAANNKRSMLVGGISESDLELAVEDASSWPDSGAITIDIPIARLRTLTSSEIVYYNGRSGNILTLTERGADDTTAKAWASGSAVEFRHIAKHHNLHSEAIIALQSEVETKVGASHTHALDSVIGLEAALAAKPDLSEVVAKSGDVMTGALTLASAPTIGMHAATKTYVDSVVGGAPVESPGIYRPEAYGAVASLVTTIGSITSGTPTLTVASASSFAIGHGIYVDSAGSAGAALVTAITAISGTHITLATNASATVSNALVQHDNTAAIQNAINAAVNAGGGRVVFAPGVYRVNGPFQSTNSILNVPYIPITGGSPVPVMLEAVAPPPWFSFDGPVSNAGVIIQSDRMGTNSDSAIFAAATWVPGTEWNVFTNVVIYIDGIQFRTYDNPRISALDLGMAGGASVKNLFIDTGVRLQDGAEPTFGTFALRMPRANTPTGYMNADQVYVMNYDTGCILAESNGFLSFCPLRCKKGIYMAFNFHPLRAYVGAWQCTTPLHFADRSVVDFNASFEIAPDGFWYSTPTGRHVYDPTDQVHGLIRYSSIRSGTGAEVPISKTGATAVAFTNLRA